MEAVVVPLMIIVCGDMELRKVARERHMGYLPKNAFGIMLIKPVAQKGAGCGHQVDAQRMVMYFLRSEINQGIGKVCWPIAMHGH